jgi:hypothetical protein
MENSVGQLALPKPKKKRELKTVIKEFKPKTVNF